MAFPPAGAPPPMQGGAPASTLVQAVSPKKKGLVSRQLAGRQEAIVKTLLIVLIHKSP